MQQEPERKGEVLFMEKVCDLHTHSVFSDGTWTPEELIREAERIGLSAIALTDHNTVFGLPRFLEAAKDSTVEAIPGVEFSTDYLGRDIHLVAHYVVPEYFSQVTEKMEDGSRQKDESNRKLIENLSRIGMKIDYESMVKSAPKVQLNRANIASVMVKNGWVRDMQDAFNRYLEPGCGLYEPPRRPSLFEMIRFTRSIGAVPVLAHPFLKLSEAELRTLLPQAKEQGLAAMETEYVSFDAETTALAKNLAGEYGLLQSGGSDFHGDNKPGIFLGVGRGNLRVPLSFRDGIYGEAVISPGIASAYHNE